MLHGPYDGTLGSWLGSKLTMSRAVADTGLKNLAVYEPGFPQDNRGGAYPPATMMSLRSLFDYMATFTPPFPQGSCYTHRSAFIPWRVRAQQTAPPARARGSTP